MLDRNKMILESIIGVEEHKDHMEIKMKWASTISSKSKIVDLHINYFDEDDCYKITKTGKIHRFTINNGNIAIHYRDSKISAETFVYLAHAWKNNIEIETYGMCADVKDGSGTNKAREKHNLMFNIHPDNIQWVSRTQNLINGQHNAEREYKEKMQKIFDLSMQMVHVAMEWEQ